MAYFGDPMFYQKHVRQALVDLYPPPEQCHKIGTNPSEIKAQLEELKAQRRAAKQAKMEQSSSQEAN
ncbi:hypothetical protein IWQ61_010107 [Dispira simplex]|nr:hypothetical protein IWQ61_010107 [Dispira simplex]